MTITANELLQLIFKVEKLGYTCSTNEDEEGGYEIKINYGNEWGEQVELYINKNSDRWNNNDYDEFNEVMEDLDRQLKARVFDEDKEERFKQYLKLKKEFVND